MTIHSSRSLSESENEEVWKFLSGFAYIPYQQFPEYPGIEGLNMRYFTAREDGAITGWVQVIEKKNILAAIEFGPLGVNAATISALLLHVTSYYRNKLFTVFRWIPYWYTTDDYAQIVSRIGERLKLEDPGNLIHWSSKRLSLAEGAEVILKGFSENHRRNIKKGLALAIECRLIKDGETVNQFIEGYVDMYQHRKLPVDSTQTAASFRRLHRFLETTGRGFFMGAFLEGKLLGGVIIIFQGETAFYYKGYINHEQRQLPINHTAFYQAILHSKMLGMSWFDFGGYALDTNDEQLININKFKDGFRGGLISFPPSRMIRLNLFSKLIYTALSLKYRK